MSLMALNVTEATFEEEVLKSETPVIVDFWAEWCGPCHAVAPVLDKIVEERKDAVKLVKVNIDEEQSLSLKYGVMSIPTMILFKDGEPAAAAVGAQPKSMLERSLGWKCRGARNLIGSSLQQVSFEASPSPSPNRRAGSPALGLLPQIGTPLARSSDRENP